MTGKYGFVIVRKSPFAVEATLKHQNDISGCWIEVVKVYNNDLPK
jgi:hypothetical protein